MPKPAPAPDVPVYIERGAKRTFACAVEWPGWSRSGRDDAAALQALFDSAPRYARVVARTGLGFSTPRSLGDLKVVERLAGNATTDFGAPGAEPKADRAALREADLQRVLTLIDAGWRALDGAARGARGKALSKGPRGGGRSLDAILAHVREAERGYLSALGWSFKPTATGDALSREVRVAVRDGLAASARGEIPAKGPRGGVRWNPRRFARRLAWHAIDHLWEIEDRVAGAAAPAATVSRSPAPARSTRASARAPRVPTRSRARR